MTKDEKFLRTIFKFLYKFCRKFTFAFDFYVALKLLHSLDAILPSFYIFIVLLFHSNETFYFEQQILSTGKNCHYFFFFWRLLDGLRITHLYSTLRSSYFISDYKRKLSENFKEEMIKINFVSRVSADLRLNTAALPHWAAKSFLLNLWTRKRKQICEISNDTNNRDSRACSSFIQNIRICKFIFIQTAPQVLCPTRKFSGQNQSDT